METSKYEFAKCDSTMLNVFEVKTKTKCQILKFERKLTHALYTVP